MPENPAQRLAQQLNAAKTPADYHRALRNAYSAVDALVGEVIDANETELACKKGCFLCCYLRVDAKAHEILNIADYVEASFSGLERGALNARLEEHQKTVEPLSYEQHIGTNVPCPLLIDGMCSVYSVRPFGCRRHQSQDFDSCQYSYDNPEDIHHPSARNNALHRATGHAEMAVNDVYSSKGFDSQGYELGTALKEALSNPKSRKRWKKGSKTF
ncbi:YkgJ family cysteine cluster protein [Phragmitibacter flavus]|nr:YkgJ family cysteine cluster protein [Phragmitibacter flavus]